MNLLTIFQQVYNRKNWQDVLLHIFGNDIKIALYDREKELTNTEKKTATSLAQIGSIKNDKIEMPIYEVCLESSKKIQYNRVEVNSLIAKYITRDSRKGAFCVFYSPDKTEWRFSFVGRQEFYDAEGKAQERNTAPKRYTYLFGTPETHKTAQSRFEALRQSNKDYQAIFDAFSVEKVSDDFFNGYRKHYENFCKDLYAKMPENTEITQKKARDFVKKTLGRIVFLYFLQKKNWLNNDLNFVAQLFQDCPDKQNFYQSYLALLFFDTLNKKREKDTVMFPNGKTYTVPYLNGGLFEPDEALPTSPVCFNEQLFGDLFNFFAQYNFTIDEEEADEAEIAVNPEMLGRIFENLLEDNKEKGTFYTPASIVRYMCQESLLAYLRTQGRQAENLPTLIRHKDATGLAGKEKEVLIQDLKKLKVCDPAIGSGAFPMGVLTEMMQILLALNPAENRYELKKHIIENCIYGVDLEKGAVDIARLRFWLALVIDEEKAQPLPNLDYKIMQGNSLIESFEGIPLAFEKKKYEQQFQKAVLKDANLFGEFKNPQVTLMEHMATQKTEFDFAQALRLYFAHNDSTTKKALQKKIFDFEVSFIQSEIKQRIKDADQQIEGWQKVLNDTPIAEKTKLKRIEKQLADAQKEKERYELAYQKAQNIKYYEKPYFLWHLYFQEAFEKGGFDIVIGNPPYIKEYNNREAFDGIRDTEHYQGKMDIWYAFATKCLEFTKPKTGVLCYIATNNWVTNSGASQMRNKILKDATILQIVDFGASMVFESAAVQTMVMLFQHDNSQDNYTFDYARLIGEGNALPELKDILAKKQTPKTEYLTPIINRAKLKDQFLTFGADVLTTLLNHIKEQQNFFLDEKEIANGIHPHYDYVNKKTQQILGSSYRVGQGIFVLSEAEKEALQPNAKELELLKPYYTTEQLGYYYGNPKNKEWIIYTDSRFKKPENIKPYPHIKKHLDQFQDVITSDNRPYGLHRAREESFFQGEKIVALRMCPNYPVFTYTDFDCYVSATFYVIKTNRINQKYLTALFNSSLVRFWLKNKGKMLGNGYQLDKEPLLNIPIKHIEDTKPFEIIMDYLLFLREQKNHNPQDKQGVMISYFQSVLDTMIFELYFEEATRKVGRQVLPHLQDLVPIEACLPAEKHDIVRKAFEQLHHEKHPVRIAEYYLDVIPAYKEIRNYLQTQAKSK